MHPSMTSTVCLKGKHVCVFLCALLKLWELAFMWFQHVLHLGARIMASRHYQQHASLSGISSIEILGDNTIRNNALTADFNALIIFHCLYIHL